MKTCAEVVLALQAIELGLALQRFTATMPQLLVDLAAIAGPFLHEKVPEKHPCKILQMGPTVEQRQSGVSQSQVLSCFQGTCLKL